MLVALCLFFPSLLPYVVAQYLARTFLLAFVIIGRLRAKRHEARQSEAELIAWRFAQPPSELTSQERAAGWQVMRFDDGPQCKILKDTTRIHRLCGSTPSVLPEPHIFESEFAKQRASAAQWSPYEFAEDLARRRAALKDSEF